MRQKYLCIGFLPLNTWYGPQSSIPTFLKTAGFAWQVRHFWLARQLTLLTARLTIEGYFLQNNCGFDYSELLL